MNSNEINDKLKSLFTGEFLTSLKNTTNKITCDDSISHGILFPYIFEDYVDSNKKIMYCGKQISTADSENMSTLHELKQKSIQDFYDENITTNKSRENYNDDADTPYWRFASLISGNNTKSLYCTDLFKIVRKNEGLGEIPIDELIKPEFFTIKQEIEIAKPDVVIFTTLSGKYFKYLRQIFKQDNLEYKNIKFVDDRSVIKTAMYGNTKFIITYTSFYIERTYKKAIACDIFNTIYQEVGNNKTQ